MRDVVIYVSHFSAFGVASRDNLKAMNLINHIT